MDPANRRPGSDGNHHVPYFDCVVRSPSYFQKDMPHVFGFSAGHADEELTPLLLKVSVSFTEPESEGSHSATKPRTGAQAHR